MGQIFNPLSKDGFSTFPDNFLYISRQDTYANLQIAIPPVAAGEVVYATDAQRLYVGIGGSNGVYELVAIANVADTAPSVYLNYTGNAFAPFILEVAPPQILNIYYSGSSTSTVISNTSGVQKFTAPITYSNSLFSENKGLRKFFYEEPDNYNGIVTFSISQDGTNSIGYVTDGIFLSNCAYLKSFSLGNSLLYCGGDVTFQKLSGSVTGVNSFFNVSLSIPGYIGGNLLINNCTLTRTVGCPTPLPLNGSDSNQIGSFIQGSVTITNCPRLFSPSTIFQYCRKIGGNVNLSSNAISQANINLVLGYLAAMDGTNNTIAYSNKTIDLSGGTNGVPTNTIAITTLQSRGCTVIHN